MQHLWGHFATPLGPSCNTSGAILQHFRGTQSTRIGALNSAACYKYSVFTSLQRLASSRKFVRQGFGPVGFIEPWPPSADCSSIVRFIATVADVAVPPLPTLPLWPTSPSWFEVARHSRLQDWISGPRCRARHRLTPVEVSKFPSPFHLGFLRPRDSELPCPILKPVEVSKFPSPIHLGF